MDAKITEMIISFGEYEFCDIIVEPFSLKIDGFIFGLIPNEETGTINLYPNDTICFYHPWDGRYDT